MPTLRTIHITSQVKVAAVFDAGSIRPAWFQPLGEKPIPINQICSVWCSRRGEAELITFEVVTPEKYSLEYNTKTLAWTLGRTVIEA